MYTYSDTSDIVHRLMYTYSDTSGTAYRFNSETSNIVHWFMHTHSDTHPTLYTDSETNSETSNTLQRFMYAHSVTSDSVHRFMYTYSDCTQIHVYQVYLFRHAQHWTDPYMYFYSELILPQPLLPPESWNTQNKCPTVPTCRWFWQRTQGGWMKRTRQTTPCWSPHHATVTSEWSPLSPPWGRPAAISTQGTAASCVE